MMSRLALALIAASSFGAIRIENRAVATASQSSECSDPIVITFAGLGAEKRKRPAAPPVGTRALSGQAKLNRPEQRLAAIGSSLLFRHIRIKV